VGDLLQKLPAMPDAAAAAEFRKLAYSNIINDEKSAAGSRGGVRLMEMTAKANPTLDTPQKAIQDIINRGIVAHQMDEDYAQGRLNWITQQRQSANNGGMPKPLTQFETQWSSPNVTQRYLAATNALNGDANWAKGLKQQDVVEAARIAARADPNATIINPATGKPVRLNQQ
jgi:hypothetical protein